LLGFKHDISPSLAVHFGGAHQIGNNLGGADWRVYAGMNWAIGPVCKTKAEEPVLVAGPPPPVAHEPQTFTLTLRFDWNSDQVDTKQIEELAPKLHDLFADGLEKVTVEGHTDSVGDPSYNIDLSERRAKSVLEFLKARYKIPESAAEYKGLGAQAPIADNGNYQGRRQNRRVEIKIVRK
jgi:OOP family OmpA-OmpF porin